MFVILVSTITSRLLTENFPAPTPQKRLRGNEYHSIEVKTRCRATIDPHGEYKCCGRFGLNEHSVKRTRNEVDAIKSVLVTWRKRRCGRGCFLFLGFRSVPVSVVDIFAWTPGREVNNNNNNNLTPKLEKMKKKAIGVAVHGVGPVNDDAGPQGRGWQSDIGDSRSEPSGAAGVGEHIYEPSSASSEIINNGAGYAIRTGRRLFKMAAVERHEDDPARVQDSTDFPSEKKPRVVICFRCCFFMRFLIRRTRSLGRCSKFSQRLPLDDGRLTVRR